MGFCDYLKDIKMDCNRCSENDLSACSIKLGTQEYYKGFELNDTISIIRHDHFLSVETDIEFQYKTKYPYGVYAGKGAEFAAEYTNIEKTMRDELTPKLAAIGAKLLTSHQHYSPDIRDPEIVAVHIHAHKSVEDLDEAKIIVEKLAELIKPKEIEANLPT